MGKLVYGVGLNECNRPVTIDGKPVKEYDMWKGMLRRCHSEKFLATPSGRTYKGCSVSASFLSYTYFYDWCHNQIGFWNFDDNERHWHLDKDILFVGNKLYSETTCVFVPQEVNKFFTDSANARGILQDLSASPVGVSFHKATGKYQAYCNVNTKQHYLGLFDTPQEAFVVYKTFKEALCKQLALKWQHEIDPRLFDAMMKWEVKSN